MNISNIYFEIQVDNIERAIAFYKSVLGWKFTVAHGTPIPYWRIETGNARGGLLQRPAPKPPEHCGTNSFCCSFEVRDIDAATKAILGAGGNIAVPKFPIHATCWQGYFHDTEGNIFGTFEVDKQAGKKIPDN